MTQINKVKKIAIKKPIIVKETTINYKNNILGESFPTIEELIISMSDDDIVDIELNNEIVAWEEEALPKCCGIIEIGNIDISKDINIKELTKFLDLYVQDRDDSNKKVLTYIINTNGRDSSIFMEAALLKCKMWTKVKQFVSSNSNNTITMWISNNG